MNMNLVCVCQKTSFLTLAIVSSSGTSSGCAQSATTAMSQTCRRERVMWRNAAVAILWLVKSRNAKPRFFFFSSSGDEYTITSTSPSGNGKNTECKGIRELFTSTSPFGTYEVVRLFQCCPAFHEVHFTRCNASHVPRGWGALMGINCTIQHILIHSTWDVM